MANQLHIGGGYFTIGNKFDSRNRYIRAPSNPAEGTLYLCRGGPSLVINATSAGQAAWTWQCGPAFMQSETGVTPPASGFNFSTLVTL